ncbi:MAG: ABC transporter substrate-binding protein [Rhizobiales bacterium]|nr:ABC transporter substrate-binding protein [Hyphomicrobiales bacterium]
MGAVAAAALATTSITAFAGELPKNVRMVIGSKSTGGDTYQNSAIIADALAEKLGINIKVDAVGSTEGFKALKRDKRGSTIMMFHDQAYLGELYGRKGYDDPFTTYKIGAAVAINPGNSYLVAKDSKYKNMTEIFAAAAAGEKIRVAIQPGGVSEIGFSAMKNAAKVLSPGSEVNLVAVKTGSQSDKNQAMFDDLADVINGSIQANEQFTQLPADDQKAMRFVWVTARAETLDQAPAKGMGDTTRDQLLAYANPKTSVPLTKSENFTFDKEFFLLYNKDMDEGMVKQIDTALAEIFAEGKIQERQKGSFFIPNFLPSDEASVYYMGKRDIYRKIIQDITK